MINVELKTNQISKLAHFQIIKQILKYYSLLSYAASVEIRRRSICLENSFENGLPVFHVFLEWAKGKTSSILRIKPGIGATYQQIIIPNSGTTVFLFNAFQSNFLNAFFMRP